MSLLAPHANKNLSLPLASLIFSLIKIQQQPPVTSEAARLKNDLEAPANLQKLATSYLPFILLNASTPQGD